MKQHKQVEQEPEFNYHFIAELDIESDPTSLFRWIQEQKILCSKCHARKKVYFKPKFIKIICDQSICGVTIIYPKRTDRNDSYLVRHVSAHEVKRDGRRGKKSV